MKNVTVLNFAPQISNHLSFPYVYALLRHYYEINGSTKYNWVDPKYIRQNTDPKEVAQWLATLNLEFLLCSLYVWNYSYSHAVMREYKKLCPNTIIAVGGPHVFPEDQYFIDHPWVSLCCDVTTYGELFVTDLLDGNEWKDIIGAVWSGHRSTKPFIIRDFKWAPSPYRNSLVFATELCLNDKVAVQLETSRGCPFKCSFCEWGGGIGTKMNKRPLDEIKADVDAMVAAGVDTIQICDSNFGFWTEDIEIMQHIANYKKLIGIPREVEIYGWSKNNVKHHFDILSAMQDAGFKQHYAVSLQSIREHTLKNVRRFDVPVENRIEFAKKVKNELGLDVQFEIMMALPGDTLDDYYEAINLRHEFNDFINFVWWVLPNTEAHTETYRKTHGLVTAWAETVESDFSDQQEITWEENKDSWEYVIGTNSLLPEEWLEAFILDRFYITAKMNTQVWKKLELTRLELNLSPKDFWKRVINVLSCTTQSGWGELWKDAWPEIQKLIVPNSVNKSLYILNIKGNSYTFPDLANEWYNRALDEIIEKVSDDV
jgi:tRNA A37 methylthiotransferase MiaB